ncbi:MAG: DUF4405 domain-containing protein [Candidatus Omnitrophica bacterium]|nr:DUF4405 domain-containing protein [Candidatus Omnitrophota bacterium]MDD5653878.1 DUF4405 domain-containing protein [Candidatus Omnitrophota bacterium]
MNKPKWLVWLNPFLFLSLLMQAASGAVLFFNLMPAWDGLIARVHSYNGFIFALLALTHLILNWNWVKANFFKKVARP